MPGLNFGEIFLLPKEQIVKEQQDNITRILEIK